jgi:hypothetical protein
MQVASRIWCLWGIIVAAPTSTIGGGIPAKPLAMLGPLPIQLNLISLLTAWWAPLAWLHASPAALRVNACFHLCGGGSCCVPACYAGAALPKAARPPPARASPHAPSRATRTRASAQQCAHL